MFDGRGEGDAARTDSSDAAEDDDEAQVGRTLDRDGVHSSSDRSDRRRRQFAVRLSFIKFQTSLHHLLVLSFFPFFASLSSVLLYFLFFLIFYVS